VPGRHVHAAGERLDVQRLRVLPVDPVADAAQPREVAQVLRRGGPAGHLRDRAIYDASGCTATVSADRRLSYNSPEQATEVLAFKRTHTSDLIQDPITVQPINGRGNATAPPGFVGPAFAHSAGGEAAGAAE